MLNLISTPKVINLYNRGLKKKKKLAILNLQAVWNMEGLFNQGQSLTTKLVVT